jgi:hypothetical protein
MIPSLEAASQDGWRNLRTGDEFWFFLSPREKKELIRPGFPNNRRRFGVRIELN